MHTHTYGFSWSPLISLATPPGDTHPHSRACLKTHRRPQAALVATPHPTLRRASTPTHALVTASSSPRIFTSSPLSALAADLPQRSRPDHPPPTQVSQFPGVCAVLARRSVSHLRCRRQRVPSSLFSHPGRAHTPCYQAAPLHVLACTALPDAGWLLSLYACRVLYITSCRSGQGRLIFGPGVLRGCFTHVLLATVCRGAGRKARAFRFRR